MLVYFASDVHLGAPTVTDKKAHEARFVRWLDSIKGKADKLFLLGDVFDYWFEYNTVVPKGSVRTLAKLAELTDSGVEVHIFAGNHDTWLFGYLRDECGMIIHTEHIDVELCGKRFYMGHGDGLGSYDRGYNLLKWVFNCRPIQVVYSWLHPDLAGWIAETWSRLSRKKNEKMTEMHTFRGVDKEHQTLFAKAEQEAGRKRDFYVFGHRHIVADNTIGDCRVLTIGDWLWNFTYAVFDGESLKIERWT